MTRIHYSATPLRLEPRSYGKNVGFKPQGLWYSIGTAWEEWCREGDFRLENLVCVTELEIDESRILRLSSDRDVREFHGQYSRETVTGLPGYPDWPRVAECYAGVEVDPYLAHLRYYGEGLIWYYSWDVPSGCVWDLSILRTSTNRSANQEKPNET